MSTRLPLLSRLAFRGLFQNWRHSLATMLAILGGFTAVSLFDGFLAAIREYNEEHYVNKGMVGHVIIEKTGAAEHLFEDVWAYSLARAEQEKIASLLTEDKRVLSTMRYLVLSGLLSNGQNSAIFIGAAYDDAEGVKIRGPKWAWNTVAGQPLYAAPAGGGLLLGMGLADRMHCDYDHAIALRADGGYVETPRPVRCPGAGLQVSVTTEHAQVNALTLPVAGVTDFQLREFNDKVLSMPLATAQQLFDTDRVSRVIVLLRDPALIPSFLADFRARARAAGLDVEAVKWLEHPVAAISKGGLEVMGVFRGLFLGVVALIAALSVANSMLKSVNERVREIGTLRSIGFRRLDIVLLFSLEGLYLGLTACAAGVVVTSFLALLLSHVGITFKAGILSTPMPLAFALAFPLWFSTALGLSLTTFLSAWLVSRSAARMGIAEALRHTA